MALLYLLRLLLTPVIEGEREMVTEEGRRGDARGAQEGRDECGGRKGVDKKRSLDVARLRGISIKVVQLGATGSPHAPSLSTDNGTCLPYVHRDGRWLTSL